MKNHIHLNFIHEDELVTSSSVRSQVVAPALAVVLTLATLTIWIFAVTQYYQLKLLREKHNAIKTQLQPAYKSALELKERETNLAAVVDQLKAYQNSKRAFGEALTRIPAHVPPNIQFTKLEIPPPPPPLIDKEHIELGPTNSFENVRLVITGRTAGANSFEAVDHLIEAFEGDDFTNLISSASIPKGSFRQDTTKRNDAREYLLFGVECQCLPREFK